MKRLVGVLSLTWSMFAASIADAQYSVTVLHNNDGESALLDAGGGLEEFGGAARFKTMVDQTRAFYQGQGHGVLTISSGDNFLAGPEFTASLESGAPGAREFYDAQYLSILNYDAVIIGNHEFDFGPDLLSEFIGDAQGTNPTTFLSANLDFSAEANLQAQVGAGLIAPSKTVTVPTSAGNKTVGIIGATTENLPFIATVGNVAVGSVADAVNAQIAALSGSTDHIILASHLQGISEDQDLVPLLNPGIDLIIAGGGDDRLASDGAPSPASVYGIGAPASIVDGGYVPGDDSDGSFSDGPYPTTSTGADLGGNNIPIVSTDANYKYLGRVTLDFDASGSLLGVNGSSNPQRVASTTVDPVNGVAADPAIATLIQPVQTFVDGLEATLIGSTSVTLVQSSDLIRSDEQAIGNLVADAVFAKATELAGEGRFAGVAKPSIALVNGGGIRAPLAAGDITEADTFSVSRFQNFVSVVEDVTPEDLKLLLENAYSKTVGDPSNPTRQGDGTGRFAQLSGLSVTYDIHAQPLVLDREGNVITAGERVERVVLDDGTVLVEDGVVVSNETLDIATLNFLANGGDQYFDADYLSQSYSFANLAVTDQQSLSDYIRSFNGSDIGADFRYDGIADGRIVTIPEPATLTLIALVGTMACLTRRNY